MAIEASWSGDRAQPGKRRPRRRAAARVVLAVALALSLTGASAASAEKPRLIRNATSSFTERLTEPSRFERRWMRRHYFQMRGYSPFFERHALPWRPPRSSFYQDLYAIYNPSERDLLLRHPDWVLRDFLGRPLYLPYDCAGGTCPQYAADVGNPGWRAHWIAQAQRTFETSARHDPSGRGWTGIFIDDVNLEMRISDGEGNPATPLDTRRFGPMSHDAWQSYMADFVDEIRAAFPRAEIAHNPLWWLSRDDPEVLRQTMAADWIELERGFNDAGLTPGGGTFGYETFLAHVDWLHGLGKSVILEPYLDTPSEARYELANYFLVRQGRDAIASDFRTDPPLRRGARPPWPGWFLNPGKPFAARAADEQGLWRRDFTRASAVVNPPGGEQAVTVSFERPHTSVSGERARSFTLDPREGDVYVPVR